MKKDLSTYFDDWVHVRADPGKDCKDKAFVSTMMDYFLQPMDEWCIENYGIRALHWDRYYLDYQHSPKYYGYIYKFKNDDAAMMFILRWGGEIVKRNNKLK